MWSIVQLAGCVQVQRESAITVQCSVDFYSHRQFAIHSSIYSLLLLRHDKEDLALEETPSISLSSLLPSFLPSLQHEDTVRLMKGGDPACLPASSGEAGARQRKARRLWRRRIHSPRPTATARSSRLIVWPPLRSTQKMHRVRLYISAARDKS